MSDNFYNDDWKRLFRQHPLVAKKIEALRCESVGYEEFEALRKRVELLERQVPAEVEVKDEEGFGGLSWKDFQGNKGPFQRTSRIANNNSETFLKLQTILKENKGFCQIDGYTYWFDHNDPEVIDRRKGDRNNQKAFEKRAYESNACDSLHRLPRKSTGCTTNTMGGVDF